MTRRSQGAAPARWYWVLSASVATIRLGEVLLSRRLEKGRTGPRAGQNSFPLMVATHVSLFVLPVIEARASRSRSRHLPLWSTMLGCATALRWWSIRSLGAEWNIHGQVSPTMRPVTSGPYRWIRHPNYLAVGLEFLALPMTAGAWRSATALTVLDCLVLKQRIASEERLLAAIPGYQEAFAGKARFIPGFF